MNLPSTIPHLTLNTGHVRQSPRHEVSRDAIEILRPLLVEGTRPLPGQFRDYNLKSSPAGSCLLATIVGPGGRPCVTFGVAGSGHESGLLWSQLRSTYYRFSEIPPLASADLPAPPDEPPCPWLASVVLLATPDEAHWIADLERCCAWAWLEHVQEAGP